jgi:hypothetical protein
MVQLAAKQPTSSTPSSAGQELVHTAVLSIHGNKRHLRNHLDQHRQLPDRAQEPIEPVGGDEDEEPTPHMPTIERNQRVVAPSGRC